MSILRRIQKEFNSNEEFHVCANCGFAFYGFGGVCPNCGMMNP